MRLFNIIKNLSEVKTQTWTPTFTWSSGDTAPTVSNIDCYIDKIGNLYCFRGRFNITALNGSSSSASLVLSTPFQLKNSGTSTIGELYRHNQSISYQLLFRVSTSLYVQAGAGGSYSYSQLKTGYYSFCFFWFKA